MSTNLGQTWIAGTKNGVPMMFNINTGATRPIPTPKKRQRVVPSLPSQTNRYIIGQKDGRVCYFDTQTGAWSQAPQPVPVPTAFMPIPFAQPVEHLATAKSTPLDTSMHMDDSLDNILNDSFLDGIAQDLDLDLAKGLDCLERADLVPRGDLPQPGKHMTDKRKLRKIRNRESAIKSRMKRQEEVMHFKATVLSLEAQVAELQKALAVSNAENKVLKGQIGFLQTIVTGKMQKR